MRLRSIALLAPLSGCSGGVLDPKGPVGAAERLILANSMVIMLAIVVPVIVMTIAFAWWWRASNDKARHLPDWAYSGQVELVVWGIPALVVLFLGGIAWVGSHRLDPYRALDGGEPLEVQVVALDWKWLFIYPAQGVASVNDLVVPAGRPLRFRITSASVMNAFFVPQLGSMVYAMNGMETRLHLQADVPGRYDGLSAHYSGDGFSDMRFTVRALPAAGFDAWATATRGAGAALTTADYARLAEQSRRVAPVTWRAVEPGLFDAIVQRTAPPAPGPKTTEGGTVSPRSKG